MKLKKYDEGGVGPDQKKNKGRIKIHELPSSDQKRIKVTGKGSFRDSGKYENFHNMNLYSASPSEAMSFYKMSAAKKMLNAKGMSVGADMSPSQVANMAKTKLDMNAVNAKAKENFLDWSTDRKDNPKKYVTSSGYKSSVPNRNE